MMQDPLYEACFRVTSKRNLFERSLASDRFILSLGITFPNPVPIKGYFTVSTEENSYGIGHQKWFDGEVQIFKWDIGSWLEFNIVDITEYHYLGSTCSEKPYYQCLADRLAKLDSDALIRKQIMEQNNVYACKSRDNPNSYINKTCSPISLPFSNNKMPICKLGSRANRFFQRVVETLMKDQEEH